MKKVMIGYFIVCLMVLGLSILLAITDNTRKKDKIFVRQSFANQMVSLGGITSISSNAKTYTTTVIKKNKKNLASQGKTNDLSVLVIFFLLVLFFVKNTIGQKKMIR